MNEPIIVYKPNKRHETPILKTWSVLARKIFSSKELILQLLIRDLTSEYKKSFIGLVWIFLTPVFGILSWVFLNGTGLLNPGETDIPYPAYLLISTSIWSLFISFYKGARNTLLSGKGLITQIKYSHEVFFIENALLAFINFSVVFSVNIVVLLALGIPISIGIFGLPVVLIPIFFLGGSIGLIASMLSIVAVDFSKLIDYFMGLLIFITPVIYSPNIENSLIQTISRVNPLTFLVGASRDIIIWGHINDLPGFMFSSIIAFIAFLISTRLFYVSETRLVERML